MAYFRGSGIQTRDLFVPNASALAKLRYTPLCAQFCDITTLVFKLPSAIVFFMVLKSDEALIWVHVTTNAHRDFVEGWVDGKLRVRLRAVAEKGRANRALIDLLSSHFSVAKSSIEIVSGTTSRTKRIRLPNSCLS